MKDVATVESRLQLKEQMSYNKGPFWVGGRKDKDSCLLIMNKDSYKTIVDNFLSKSTPTSFVTSVSPSTLCSSP